eukprot:TRINITY_DN53920_c0_g1_i1.p1 TRINITY_DN53920_c0_g1~~TRINITY_DN53920_c0_g1_i1.p1  ORF type:complete len:161 (+),score=1.72 TRINITY_DN53920_c0_g1_i1:163-645(+)
MSLSLLGGVRDVVGVMISFCSLRMIGTLSMCNRALMETCDYTALQRLQIQNIDRYCNLILRYQHQPHQYFSFWGNSVVKIPTKAGNTGESSCNPPDWPTVCCQNVKPEFSNTNIRTAFGLMCSASCHHVHHHQSGKDDDVLGCPSSSFPLPMLSYLCWCC